MSIATSPEPDLPIVEVSRERVAEIQAKLPELPDAKRQRFVDELSLTDYDAGVLVADKAIADYFEAILANAADVEAKTIANWVTGDLFRLLNEDRIDREDIATVNITPENFASLLKLVEDGTINATTARKKVLPVMWSDGTDAQKIVEDKGLAQVSDTGIISEKVQEAIDANPDMVQKYLDGNDKVINAIFGRVMGALRGQGDPNVVRQLLTEKLESMK